MGEMESKSNAHTQTFDRYQHDFAQHKMLAQYAALLARVSRVAGWSRSHPGGDCSSTSEDSISRSQTAWTLLPGGEPA